MTQRGASLKASLCFCENGAHVGLRRHDWRPASKITDPWLDVPKNDRVTNGFLMSNHWVFTGFSRGVHGVFTGFSRSFHGVFTVISFHGVFTGFSRGSHGVLTQFSRGIHGD